MAYVNKPVRYKKDGTVDMRGRHPGPNYLGKMMSPELSKGEAAKVVNFIVETMDWEPVDLNDIQALRRRTVEYFELCARHDRKPGIEGWYDAIGIDKRRMSELINHKPVTQRCKDVSPEALDEIIRIKHKFTTMMESYMTEGSINYVAGIFIMKNHYGYRDQSDVVVTPNTPIDGTLSIEAAEERLRLKSAE